MSKQPDVYTADNTNEVNAKRTLYERAADLVDSALSELNGGDLLYMANVYFMLTECDSELTRPELLRLTERITDASYISGVPLLSAERVDAVRYLVDNGITKNRFPEFPISTPDQTKNILLKCDLEVLSTLIDYVAYQNQEFFGPDVDAFSADDIRKVEESISEYVKEELSLEDKITAAEKLVGSCIMDKENTEFVR